MARVTLKVEVDVALLRQKIALLREALYSSQITEDELVTLIQSVYIRQTENTKNHLLKCYADIELPSGMAQQH